MAVFGSRSFQRASVSSCHFVLQNDTIIKRRAAELHKVKEALAQTVDQREPPFIDWHAISMFFVHLNIRKG